MARQIKDLQNMVKGSHAISILAAILVFYLIYRFILRTTGTKDSMSSGMSKTKQSSPPYVNAYNTSVAQPAAPMGENEQFQRVEGIKGTQGLPSSCNAQPFLQADQLLPKDSNSQFQQLNPQGGGSLHNVSLLQAGYHNGIDTVGSSLRNANLQVRSEPPNPTSKVSPWMNSTIEPDLMRVPLELGSGIQ
jgi:hypothetical protein